MLESLFNTCFEVFLIRVLRCFSVNIAKFLRTTFLQNTSHGCFCTYEKLPLKETSKLLLQQPETKNIMHTFLLYAIILQATKADTDKKKKKAKTASSS